MNFHQASLLCDARAAWEGAFSPLQGVPHASPSTVGAEGSDDMANVNHSHHALGLPRGMLHTCLEPRLGKALNQRRVAAGKDGLQGP